eukprot:241495-Chlamydomonas_euryale.AAC.1
MRLLQRGCSGKARAARPGGRLMRPRDSVKGARRVPTRPSACAHAFAPHLVAPHLVAPHLVAPHLVAPHIVAPHLVAPHLVAPHPASGDTMNRVARHCTACKTCVITHRRDAASHVAPLW